MQESVKLENIDVSLSSLRLTRPEQISAMRNSLDLLGQVQPVIVRKKEGFYQVLDGFKRYFASKMLQWENLEVTLVEVDLANAKALILSCNQQGRALIQFEEAQISYSLKKEHLMKQEEIASLLSKSCSWVSRRISYIERLDQCVQTNLQLGKITPTHARELAKLPRGTQNEFLKLIITHNLTSRQLSILVFKYLQSKTVEEQKYILQNPLEGIEQQKREGEINDCRLGSQGNRLLKSVRILANVQHVFIGQCTNPPLNELSDKEEVILSELLADVVKKSKTILLILKKYNRDER
jgi:ParB/RepB/Spo0J family partition protein